MAYELARWRMASCINSSFVPFKEGDLVWLNAKNLSIQNSGKIAAEREGPFKIMEKLLVVTYCLRLSVTWKIHDIFHAIHIWKLKNMAPTISDCLWS